MSDRNRLFKRVVLPAKSSTRMTKAIEPLEPRKLFAAAAMPAADDLLANALALVDPAAATHVAVASGPWSSPSTWLNNRLPAESSSVVVPAGIEVVVDGRFETPLYWLRADGTVRFDTAVDTRLTVETFVVSPGGALVMGTAEAPVGEGVTARLVFSDSGALSLGYDPTLLSRGLLSFGSVSVWGSEVSGYVPATGATAGSTTLTLQAFASGWKAGDLLIIPGTDPARTNDDEERTIVSVVDDVVTLDRALRFNHSTGDSRFDLLVANVSRNVIFESQNVEQNNRRGHVLISGSGDVSMSNVGLYGLGRSDKRKELTELPAAWEEVDTDTLNVASRHALYLRDRTGSTTVTGSAVVDSPGLGVSMRNAAAMVEFNVAFDVAGTAFMVEDAASSGSLRDNLAIKSEGSRQAVEKRRGDLDFGHSGHGFFVMSGLVDVSGNTAWSQRSAGVVLYLGGVTAPLVQFADNNAFFGNGGLEVYRYNPTAVVSLTRFDAVGNRGRGISLVASGNLLLDGGTLRAAAGKFASEGISTDSNTTGVAIKDFEISGFETGVVAPQRGSSTIVSTELTNVVNVHVERALEDARSLTIDHSVVMSTPVGNFEDTPYDVFLDLTVEPEQGDIARVFDPKSAWIGVIQRTTADGKSLRYYLADQAVDAVPFATADAPATTPPEFLDKTNAELLAEFGLTTGGVMAPADSVAESGSNGLVSASAPTYAARLQQLSPRYTSNPAKYRLSYRDLAGKRITEKSTALTAGWNVLTRDIAGTKVTFMVYADVQTPAFELSTPLRINPLDLARGLRIAGTITDDSFGSLRFSRHLKGLEVLPQSVGTEGLPTVNPTFTIKDRAGNSLLISVTVTIDPTAPLQKQTKLTIGNRKLSPTLVALLDTTAAPLFSSLTLGQVNSLEQAVSLGQSAAGGASSLAKTVAGGASQLSKETTKAVKSLF
jgi:hypothetical protein